VVAQDLLVDIRTHLLELQLGCSARRELIHIGVVKHVYIDVDVQRWQKPKSMEQGAGFQAQLLKDKRKQIFILDTLKCCSILLLLENRGSIEFPLNANVWPTERPIV